QRTKYGGSEAMPRAPTQADPRSIVSRTKVDEDIGLKTMWQGYAFPGEFFVFVFFGLVATVGSCFLQTGQFSWASAAAGGMIGALAAAVLVVNNYRDLESDRRSAKITLAVRVGYVATRLEFAALVLLPFAALPLLAVLTGTGLWMLLPLASAPIAVRLIRDLVRAPISPALNPLLKRTARLEFVFGLLVCAALAL
ncbi:MAG: UbiA family prenyltransferase, partial [Burkholderiales bacterium]